MMVYGRCLQRYHNLGLPGNYLCRHCFLLRGWAAEARMANHASSEVGEYVQPHRTPGVSSEPRAHRIQYRTASSSVSQHFFAPFRSEIRAGGYRSNPLPPPSTSCDRPEAGNPLDCIPRTTAATLELKRHVDGFPSQISTIRSILIGPSTGLGMPHYFQSVAFLPWSRQRMPHWPHAHTRTTYATVSFSAH
ncbi:hypothetical protein LX32DRAFT_132028 [Colletotrichum zoysiae]|uniref:Uncharacterized protein n=1 Tax=Colletotrichum zoysiae TaxID=1216348 RepID=A0AAD9LVJ3_9PEZI|nr:hypothetical protein LX32DRAFT_132028 [Colletotrichum zoysiae]